MKSKSVVILFAAVICAIICASSAFALTRYKVTDLGTLGGGYQSYMTAAINEQGQVVGTGTGYDSNGNYFSRGFIWDKETGMVEIGSFGGSESRVFDISDTGQVVGLSDYPGGGTQNRHAFLWQNGSLIDLGNGAATGINNNNQIVGTSPFGTGVVWQVVDNNIVKIAFGDNDTRPQAINDLGQIVGCSWGASPHGQAFVWDQVNGMQYLPLMPGYVGSVATDINQSGQVVGNGMSDTLFYIQKPAVWMDGVMEYIGGAQGSTYAINDLGQAVGEFNQVYGTTPHAFIWNSKNGIQDLNELVIPGHGFDLITWATGINNRGQIATDANLNGKSHAVLLTPISEVAIDIKPGVYPNSINLGAKGTVPVAILTTDDFDATTVDPTTVRFAGAPAIKRTMEDVDSDGYLDVLLHFDTQELNLDASNTEATLTGMTDDRIAIVGTDSVNIVPKRKK